MIVKRRKKLFFVVFDLSKTSFWKKFAAQFITSQRLCYVFLFHKKKFTFINTAHSREHKIFKRENKKVKKLSPSHPLRLKNKLDPWKIMTRILFSLFTGGKDNEDKWRA